MKRCPFMKIIEIEGNTREEIFKSCIGKYCMAFKDNKCSLIEKSDFTFMN